MIVTNIFGGKEKSLLKPPDEKTKTVTKQVVWSTYIFCPDEDT